MANTLLDAQTNISNDTLKEIVSASAFIGETAAPTASVYTHATYGTLVGSFSTAWNPTATTISFTENNPQPGDDDVIMSDANFQNVRANATAGRVFYVWGPAGSSLTNYREFNRSDLESANVRPSPTTSINPNNFGTSAGSSPDADYRLHFWNETSGATLVGGDYSAVGFRNSPSKTLVITNYSSINYVGTNYTSGTTYNGKEYIVIQIDYLHIFYK